MVYLVSKVCKGCGKVKPRTAFYATKGMADGLASKCKDCVKTYQRERRRTNPWVQEYDRDRAKEPHRKAAARAVTIRWREKYPERYQAQTAVGNAIRDGKLEKGEICEIQGCARTDVHAHHEDYSKPLEVRWLCPLHHHRGHAAEKQEAPHAP